MLTKLLLMLLWLMFLVISITSVYPQSLLFFVLLMVPVHIIYLGLVYNTFKSKQISQIGYITTSFGIAVILVMTSPTLSDDIWRYLWDGMLLTNKISPYFIAPSEISQFHTSQIYSLMAWKEQFTLYPPFAQYIFWITFSIYKYFGIIGAKIFLGSPIVALFVILKRYLSDKYWALLIINPLLLIEIFYSGHIEGFIVLFLTMSFLTYKSNKLLLSSAFLSLAFMTKIYPIIFLPLYLFDLVRQKKIKAAVMFSITFTIISAALYLPLSSNPLSHLKRLLEWTSFMDFNASIFRYAYRFFEIFIENGRSLAHVVVLSIFGISTIFFLRKKLSLSTIVLFGITYLILSPIVFPWYTLFLIPFVFLYAKKMNDPNPIYGMIIMQLLLAMTYISVYLNILPWWDKNYYTDRLFDLEYAILAIILLKIYLSNHHQIPREAPSQPTKTLKKR